MICFGGEVHLGHTACFILVAGTLEFEWEVGSPCYSVFSFWAWSLHALEIRPRSRAVRPCAMAI